MPNALSVALAALFADPNIGQDRKDTTFAILRAFVGHDVMVSAQALDDLFVVLTRKAKRNTAVARDSVMLAVQRKRAAACCCPRTCRTASLGAA